MFQQESILETQSALQRDNDYLFVWEGKCPSDTYFWPAYILYNIRNF